MLRIDPDPNAVTFTHSAMATEFSFQLCGNDPDYLKQTAYEASLLIDSLERKLSLYQEGSDISRINALNRGEKIRISAETTECLKQAFEASLKFRGRFNPFVGRAAIRSKNQDAEFTSLPAASTSWSEPEAIIAFDPDSQTIEKMIDGYLLDLGAIGKGFTLDQLAVFLEDWDVQNGLINAGGSSLLLLPDSNPDTWKIEYGTNSENQLPYIPGVCLASSGSSFQEEHIIDPSTGISRSLWKRTHVMSSNAAFADATSTAAMLLEENELKVIVEAENDLSLLMIRAENDQRVAIGEGFSCFASNQR